jgi:hypothetical protein
VWCTQTKVAREKMGKVARGQVLSINFELELDLVVVEVPCW